MIYRAKEVLEYLDDVYDEVGRQQGLWGVQVHPDGTGSEKFKLLADEQRKKVDDLTEKGELTWAEIFLEEVYEALATDKVPDLIEELTQAAAVAISWRRNIEDR